MNDESRMSCDLAVCYVKSLPVFHQPSVELHQCNTARLISYLMK